MHRYNHHRLYSTTGSVVPIGGDLSLSGHAVTAGFATVTPIEDFTFEYHSGAKRETIAHLATGTCLTAPPTSCCSGHWAPEEHPSPSA